MINIFNKTCYELKDAYSQEPIKETFETTSPWVVDLTRTIITGYTGSDIIINIPYSINGIIIKQIKSINSAVSLFSNPNNITTVNFPTNSEITKIGFYTFFKCPNITNIILPPKLTYIDDAAFINCSKLITISIALITANPIAEILAIHFQFHRKNLFFFSLVIAILNSSHV